MQSSPRKSRLIRLATLIALFPVAISGQVLAADGNQIDEKLNVYVECYNKLDGTAHRTIERYASWVKNMKAGPTGKEQVVYGLYRMDSKDVAECKEQFAGAQKLKPELGLDGAGADYIKALGSLTQIVEAMYPYYDREDYKDDKFAKAKEFHGKFVAEIDLFQAASKRFSHELNVENDKRLEAEMVQIEKEQGRKLPYLNMATMHRAKLLVRVLEKDTFTAEEVSAPLAAFEAAADEQLAFAKANPQGLPIMWSFFTGTIEDFRKTAKERMRRVRDKTPYSTGDLMMINAGSGWMISGTTDKLIKAYNELVTRSNGLR